MREGEIQEELDAKTAWLKLQAKFFKPQMMLFNL